MDCFICHDGMECAVNGRCPACGRVAIQHDKVERIIETASLAEDEDRHLTDSSRARVVRAFERYYDFIPSDYPLKASITDRYIFIVFDL